MFGDAAKIRHVFRVAAIMATAAAWTTFAVASDAEDPARLRRAIGYLDGRQDEWSKFGGAGRGEGADKTSCVSCHTGVSYALGRPALGRYADKPGPSTAEDRMLAAIHLRVENWAELDTPRFHLMYDFDDRKKVESRGTEAVLNSLILARDDANRGRQEIGATTRKAFQHLWETQTKEGAAAGSWDWLNFGLEPWEGEGSPAFGASLAAIAVGSAPGYLGQKLDESASKGVRSLRNYLGRRFPDESLYNRIWMLEASQVFEGLLTDKQAKEVVDQLIAARREDGGWALADLGAFKRVDDTAQVRESDGHATGLVVHALLRARSTSTRPEVAQGLAWLRSHQREDGSWPGRSVNKERDTKTFVGKLMSDAATSYASLALIEAESR